MKRPTRQNVAATTAQTVSVTVAAVTAKRIIRRRTKGIFKRGPR